MTARVVVHSELLRPACDMHSLHSTTTLHFTYTTFDKQCQSTDALAAGMSCLMAKISARITGFGLGLELSCLGLDYRSWSCF